MVPSCIIMENLFSAFVIFSLSLYPPFLFIIFLTNQLQFVIVFRHHGPALPMSGQDLP